MCAATVSVIERKRDCGAWFPWTPDISPRDHWDRRNVLEIEEARRQNDQAIVQLQLDVQRLREARSDRWTKIALALAVISVMVAAVATLAQVGSLVLQIFGQPGTTP